MPREAFAPQIDQNHGLQLFAPLRTRIPNPAAKLAMPLPSHRATIVLPDFARSLSADGGGGIV